MFSHVKHDEICGKGWDFPILNVKTFFPKKQLYWS